MISVKTFIYRRRHRSGKVSWMIRWKDPATGIWKTFTGGRTREEAQVAEMTLRRNLLLGEKADTKSHEPVTIGNLIDEYYTSPRYLSLSPEWKKSVQSQMDKIIRPNFGHYKVEDLHKEVVYKVWFGFKQDGLSHSIIQKYQYKLTILGELYSEKYPDRDNPLKRLTGFDKLFPKQAPTRNIDFLTPEELTLIYEELKHSPSPLILPFVKFLANSGLRRSEALNLKWQDIDLSAGFIHVRKSKNGRPRTIPLDPEANDALSLLQSQQHEYVFSTKEGTRYHRCSFLKPLQRAVKRAKIRKRIDIHTLRHSFGSNKIRRGWGLKKVSLLLGHSDIQTTSAIYAHLLDSDLRVQDEVRFDTEHQDSPKDLGQAISSLIGSLQTFPKDSLTPESVAELLARAFQKATTSSGKEKNPLQNLTETGQNVTHMGRAQETATATSAVASKTHSHFQIISRHLSQSKSGAGEGARTLDLKLGKLAL